MKINWAYKNSILAIFSDMTVVLPVQFDDLDINILSWDEHDFDLHDRSTSECE